MFIPMSSQIYIAVLNDAVQFKKQFQIFKTYKEQKTARDFLGKES